MNEFLTRLLARNLGSEGSLPGAVQPRPVARFETVDGMADIEVPSLIEPQPDESFYIAPATPEAKSSAPPQPKPGVDPIHEAKSVRPAKTERGDEAARLADILQTQHETHSTPPDVAHDDKMSTIEPKRADTGAFQRPAPMIVHVESVEHRAAVLPVSPSDIPSGPTEATRVTQTSPPEVRVTIGRIEINVPPSAPAPPARPSPSRRPPASIRPVRSLDDYLRRRNEGKR
jgi:hypothetical protein